MIIEARGLLLLLVVFIFFLVILCVLALGTIMRPRRWNERPRVAA